MINNQPRIGNFTSSEIVALTSKDKSGKGFGKPALTYIAEKNMERRLGRSIKTEVDAKALKWGKMLESRVFDILGLEYSLTSTSTLSHPIIPFWSGSPDGGKEIPRKTVIDIKCPWTLKSFCEIVDAGLAGGIEQIREDSVAGEKFYQQLVSNAILTDSNDAELIVYAPYRSEIEEIKMMAQNAAGEDMSKYYFLSMALEDELPFLLDGGYYKNINIFSFEVPEADKGLLADCVLRAGEMLINQPKQLAAPDESLPYAMVLEDENALKI